MRRHEPRAADTGRFSYDVATGTWTWDDEVHRLHGLHPGTVEPTLDHVLGAAVPADTARVQEAIERMVATSESFSLHYRLVGADGEERSVVLVGESAVCDPDQVSLIEGYFIDLTAEVEAVIAEATRSAVEASAEHRAVIEQAKGALMLAYGFDADAAFSMLTWWSRNRNTKVRDVAAELMAASEEGGATAADVRHRVDRLLHDVTGPATAERVPQAPRTD